MASTGPDLRILTVINGLVWDGIETGVVQRSVHIINGVVAGEVDGHEVAAEVFDARGRVVIPGLIDAHFHAYGISLNLSDLEAMPLSYVATKAATRLRRALTRGFTTVRDVAGGDIGLSRAIDEGLIEGPRYLYTGPALTQTGGHADPRPAFSSVPYCQGHMGEVIDGVDPLRAAVRERFRTGAHAIKIMASGGVVSPTDPLAAPQYSAEEIAAVCDEARRRGSYVAAHAYSPEAIVHSVDNGVRSIEHGNLIDEASARLMAEHGAFLVPTLVTYDAMRRRGDELGLSGAGQKKNKQVLAAGLGSLETARAVGVAVGLGTDLMGDLEDDQLLEFRVRSEAEHVDATLHSATFVNADLLGRPDLGHLGEGAAGDLVILNGDPFEDASVLWDPARTVVQAGRIVH